jgi:hypothetical protein
VAGRGRDDAPAYARVRAVKDTKLDLLVGGGPAPCTAREGEGGRRPAIALSGRREILNSRCVLLVGPLRVASLERGRQPTGSSRLCSLLRD